MCVPPERFGLCVLLLFSAFIWLDMLFVLKQQLDLQDSMWQNNLFSTPNVYNLLYVLCQNGLFFCCCFNTF